MEEEESVEVEEGGKEPVWFWALIRENLEGTKPGRGMFSEQEEAFMDQDRNSKLERRCLRTDEQHQWEASLRWERGRRGGFHTLQERAAGKCE